jgi:metalloreductase STEAP3
MAIGKRFLKFGCYKVIFGSRNPNKEYLKECLNQFSEYEVTTLSEAWNKSDKVVFLAVSATESIYESVIDEMLKNGNSNEKILIDVSNLTDNFKNELKNESNAERLQSLIQVKIKVFNKKNFKLNVVKGFNLVNAYSMGANEIKGNIETIPIAGDDFESKNYVAKLCNKIGYQVNDVGGLKKSLDLEISNKKTFEDWYYPSIMSILFVLINFVWVFWIYFWFPKKPLTFQKYLNDFSLLSHLNKVLGFSSLQILAFVYLGSVFASIYQLKNGTKYQQFPRYLDFWLSTRKQFGLWAFLIASFHVLTTIFITNPTYLADWYRKIDDFTPNRYGLTIMTLNGELNIIFGIISYLIMILVALSSINSIANSFNWSEWEFVQSKLGIFCLTVGLIHGIFMYARIYLEKDEFSYTTTYLLTRVKLIALYFPLLVLVLRFVFAYFPPLSNRIQMIRDGTIVKNTIKKTK